MRQETLTVCAPMLVKELVLLKLKRGRRQKLVGYATVGDPQVANEEDFNALRDAHLVPEGSKFDIKKGKKTNTFTK